MSKELLFVPLTKVDVVKREVWGVGAQEVADKSGEIMDYATSKPNFESWSNTAEKMSGGLSLGNVREMHGKSAAGKLTYFKSNDETKLFEVCAKVVDDKAWEKVVQGVYTGFSIGGSYAKRWQDASDSNLTRYTASPSEISLVDSPCIPTATFTMVKADGLEEQVEFVKVAKRPDVNPKEGEKKYGDVEYADAKNKKYSLDTEAHVRAAASYWGQAKNKSKYSAEDQKTISAKISAAEKKFKIGAEKMSKLSKGMYGVSNLASVITSLKYCAEDAKMEAMYEKDESEVPGKLFEAISLLGDILVQMAQEEVAELNPEEDEMSEATEKMMKMLEAMDAKLSKMEADKPGEQTATAKVESATESEQPTKVTDKTGKPAEEDDKESQKNTEKMTKLLEDMSARLAKMEALPAAPAGAKPVVVAIGKEQDTALGKTEKALDPNSPLDLVKMAHKAPRFLAKADLQDYLGVSGGRV